MDKIVLPELRFRAKHGLLPGEYEMQQDFTVSLTVYCNLSAAGASDDIDDSLDYRALYQAVAAVMLGEHCKLLEKLAADIANSVLAQPLAAAVEVSVRKEAADLGVAVVPAQVQIFRSKGVC